MREKCLAQEHNVMPHPGLELLGVSREGGGEEGRGGVSSQTKTFREICEV